MSPLSNTKKSYLSVSKILSLDNFFEKLNYSELRKEEVKEAIKRYIESNGVHKSLTHTLTKTIYLSLPEVRVKDPYLYELISSDVALALRAFYEALKELGVSIQGFSIGFRGDVL